MKSILDTKVSSLNKLAWILFISGIAAYIMLEFYSRGRDTGYMQGSSSGFTAGLKSKVPQPKIIIIRPPCIDSPQERADSLWRL